eukprot:5013875-Pyramimonas_sp.AAC.1
MPGLQGPRWPQEPAEMHGSSETGAKCFTICCFCLGCSGVCGSKRGGQVSETARSGLKEGEHGPRRASGGLTSRP